MTIKEHLQGFIDNDMFYDDYTPNEIINKMVEITPRMETVLEMRYEADLPLMGSVYTLLSRAVLAINIFGPEDASPEEVEQIDLGLTPAPIQSSFLDTVNSADIEKLLEAFEAELRENEKIKPLLVKELDLSNRCASLQVTSETLQEGGMLANEAAAAVAIIEGVIDPVVKKAFRFHRGITGTRSRLTKLMSVANNVAKTKVENHHHNQKVIAQQAAYDARMKALQKQQEEQRALEEKARKAREKGQEVRAQELRDRAGNVPLFIPEAPEVPEVEGAVMAKDIKVSVIDGHEADVLRAILDGYTDPDSGKIFRLPIGCVKFGIGPIKSHLKNNKIPPAIAAKMGIAMVEKSTMKSKGN